MLLFRHIAFLLSALSMSLSANAQQDITVNDKTANPVEEYSALATVGKRLLLIPQYPVTNSTYAIATRTIDKKAKRREALAEADFTPVVMEHLAPLVARINHSKHCYEGFEGAVAVGNTIFFSIETDESADSCYLFKGYLHNNIITLDTLHLKTLPKIKCRDKVVNNAGYESLTYDAASRQLLAVFEYTNAADVQQTPIAYLTDTALENTQPLTPIYINKPIPFRITDICAGKKGTMYGINFWWAGEYDDYFACNTTTPLPVKDSAAFTNSNLKASCYGRILQLQLRNNRLTWQPLQEIGFDCYNWEGIAPINKKLLIVTDANKGKYLEKTTHFRLFNK